MTMSQSLTFNDSELVLDDNELVDDAHAQCWRRYQAGQQEPDGVPGRDGQTDLHRAGLHSGPAHCVLDTQGQQQQQQQPHSPHLQRQGRDGLEMFNQEKYSLCNVTTSRCDYKSFF